MENSLLERFIQVYKKSEVIFEQDSVGREMFVTHSGQVKISLNDNGKEIVLASLGRGEFFAEMALVDDAPRVAIILPAPVAGLKCGGTDGLERRCRHI